MHFWNNWNELLTAYVALFDIRMQINPFHNVFVASSTFLFYCVYAAYHAFDFFHYDRNIFFFQPYPAHSKISFVQKFCYTYCSHKAQGSQHWQLGWVWLSDSGGMHNMLTQLRTWERLHFLVKQGFNLDFPF